MRSANLQVAPSLHAAIRLYGQWRVGDGDYSVRTWAGEAPGLLAFADFCHDAGVEEFWQLNDDLVSDWWAHVKQQVGAATAPTRLHQLRSFLGFAIRKKWLAEDPTALLRAKRPAPEPRERLDAREVLDLISSATYPQHRIILALAANLALRAAELKRLRIRDVDLDEGTIMVRVTKTDDTPPDPMPVTAELDAELRTWLAHYRAACSLSLDSSLVPGQHVEPRHGRITYKVGKPIGDPEDVVKQALARIGWDVVKGEGIHTLRRSVARLYFDAALEDGKQFDEVLLGTMRLLHHDRAETTLRYIGVDRQTMARDSYLRGRPFLTRLAGRPNLRAVQ